MFDGEGATGYSAFMADRKVAGGHFPVSLNFTCGAEPDRTAARVLNMKGLASELRAEVNEVVFGFLAAKVLQITNAARGRNVSDHSHQCGPAYICPRGSEANI